MATYVRNDLLNSTADTAIETAISDLKALFSAEGEDRLTRKAALRVLVRRVAHKDKTNNTRPRVASENPGALIDD
jgi:hypothetical protein